jgi:hypothetical protein
MYERLPGYVVAFLVAASMSVACGRTDLTVRGDFPLAPDGVALLTAEPAKIVPDFLPTPFCRSHAPFGARIRLTLRAGHDLVMRAPRFELVGNFGERFGPAAIGVFDGLPPATAAGSLPPSLPETSPIPLPQASPIPFPGSSPFDGVTLVAGGFRVFPFFLQFGCGVPAQGTLFITVETTDRRGRPDVSRASVHVGN